MSVLALEVPDPVLLGESMWAGLIRINQGEGMKRRDQQMVAGRLQSFNLKYLGLGR